MKSRIDRIKRKTLVGKYQSMSYIDNKTSSLWQSFMKDRQLIHNRVDKNYYSMQVYTTPFKYENFSPSQVFTKWAAVEVSEANSIPSGMETYVLEGGLYAVFDHIGPASDFGKSMHFIFKIWLPQSGYEVDNREHFEILEEGYNPMDEKAREEIWIPIKKVE